MKGIPIIAFAALISSCNRDDDVITERSPFVQTVAPTPLGGGEEVVKRSKAFARVHGMRFEYSFEHLSEGEYSVRLLSQDFNIATDNVRRGGNSIVGVYSRKEPDDAQRALAKEYLCKVMKYECRGYGGLR